MSYINNFIALQAWFSWFNNTQRGNISGSYRWRGRDSTTQHELNPKTLTSGLDDYPRASHPTDEEMHVDLRCWMAIAANTLAKIADLLGRDGYKYEETWEYLRDNDLLNKLHWSEYTQSYADYGYHTDSVELRRPKPSPRSQQTQSLEMVRITLKKPEYRLVDSMFGYISLFPFFLQLLDVNSLQLGKHRFIVTRVRYLCIKAKSLSNLLHLKNVFKYHSLKTTDHK